MSEEEKVETTEEPKPEWDKTRQQIDQLSSNLKGALNDNKTLRDGITSLEEKLNTLEKSLKVNQKNQKKFQKSQKKKKKKRNPRGK